MTSRPSPREQSSGSEPLPQSVGPGYSAPGDGKSFSDPSQRADGAGLAASAIASRKPLRWSGPVRGRDRLLPALLRARDAGDERHAHAAEPVDVALGNRD